MMRRVPLTSQGRAQISVFFVVTQYMCGNFEDKAILYLYVTKLIACVEKHKE